MAKHIVTHDPSTNSFLVHEPKKEPVKTFKYSDAEDRDEARSKAQQHADKLSEGKAMKTFSQFVEELAEWNAADMIKAAHGRSKGSLKGTKYTGAETDTDEDGNEIKKDEPVVKRGRGRPAGAKSGARQQGAEKSNSRDFGSFTKDHTLLSPSSSPYYK